MDQVGEKASFAKRFLAFLVDYLILGIIQSVIIGIIVVANIKNFSGSLLAIAIITATLITSLILLIKDIMNGTSLGKKIFKLGIRETNDWTTVPSKMKLIVRNLFILVWPVEFILLVLGKERLGDSLTKTNVYVIDK